MLKIAATWLRGYLSYGDMPSPVQLHGRGRVLLRGVNDDRGGDNGAGKTSFVNAITSILWNETPTGAKDDDVINRSFAWTGRGGRTRGAFGLVEYEHGAGRFRVVSCRKWAEKDDLVQFGASEVAAAGEAYTGTDLYYERWDMERQLWLDLRGEGIRDTRKCVASSLPVSYEMFCSIAYQCQGRALSFIAGGQQERSEILGSLVDYSLVDAARERVHADAKVTRERVARLAGEASVLGEHLRSQVSIDTSVLLTEHAMLDAQAVAWCAWDARIRAHRDAENAARQQRDERLRALREAREVAAQRVVAANTSIGLVKQNRLDASRRLEGALRELGRTPKSEAVVTAERAVQDCRDDLGATQRMMPTLGEPGRCPACGTLVDADTLADHRHDVQAGVEAKRVALTAAEGRLGGAVADWSAELERREAAMRDATAQELTVLDASYAGWDAELQSALVLRGELDLKVDQEPLSRVEPYTGPSEDEVRLGKDATQRRLGELEALVTSAEERQRQLDAGWARYRKTAAEHVRAASQLAYLQALDRHLRDLKTYKFGTLIASLNDLTSKYLRILTDGNVVVTFSPFKVKKDAKGKALDELSALDVTNEFEVYVRDGTKADVPLKQYSGGERQVIALALIFAFAEAARAQSTGVNILILDEVFGAIDDVNVDRVLLLLDAVSGTVSTMIIVTHSATVKGLLRPDEVWTARKLLGLTSLETTA
jgi:DNA repair exonuclease SbcCD ATPase subunit